MPRSQLLMCLKLLNSTHAHVAVVLLVAWADCLEDGMTRAKATGSRVDWAMALRSTDV